MILEYITIEASDVWDYAMENAEELANISHIIAGNEDYGVEILISKDTIDDTAVYISVEVDDEEVYGTYLTDRAKSSKICKEIYDDYLTSKIIEKLGYSEVTVISSDDDEDDGVEPEENSEEKEDIECREADIDLAVQEFVEQIAECGRLKNMFTDDMAEEVLQDLKEHFLEYMARKWGIDIYRPMYLFTENGEKYFTEFPYEELVFDDPDNPIYKNT